LAAVASGLAGVVTLSEFHNTLNAAKEGRYQECAKHMLNSDWAKQVGSRADRLARMMETGNEE
jgi:lysozyme